MISMRMCLIALVVVFVAVQTASSIKCWSCLPSKDCNKVKTNITCLEGMDACMAILDKDKKPFELNCVQKAAGQAVCDQGTLINCKVCEKDLCNSSSFVAPSIFTITIFAAVITKMYF